MLELIHKPDPRRQEEFNLHSDLETIRIKKLILKKIEINIKKMYFLGISVSGLDKDDMEHRGTKSSETQTELSVPLQNNNRSTMHSCTLFSVIKQVMRYFS